MTRPASFSHAIPVLCTIFATLLLPAAFTVTSRAAGPAPLGHPDFLPSDERPIGFRGDGNGYFAGARPVREWWDGKPLRRTMSVRGPRGPSTIAVWCFEDNKPKNVLWKIPMPGWSDAQPIVVRDRVFALCEPHFLVCVDLRSGATLWHREILPLELDGMPAAEAKAKQEVINIARAVELLLQTLDDEPSRAVDRARDKLEDLAKLVATADPNPDFAAAFDEMDDRLRAWKKGKTDKKPHGVPAMSNPLVPAVERAYKVPVNIHWYGYVGFAASTPVSDGERVYVVLPQGQVVCYDMDGNRLWGLRFREWEPLTAHHLPSPLLSGNVLIARNLTGDVVGIDKLTGEILWSPEIGEGGDRGSYLGHKLMRLEIPDAEPLDLLVTNKRKILRTTDGAVLGEFPFEKWNNGRGPSIVARGNTFLAAQSYDGPPSPCRAFRITAPASATETGALIRVTHAFQLESPVGAAHGPFGNECIVLTDRFITSYGTTWDIGNGAILGRLATGRANRGGGPVVAGTSLIYPGGGPGQSPTGRLREDELSLAAFQVVDLSDPARPILVAGHNILGGPELPNDLFADKYLEGFDKKPMLGCYRGIASWFGCRNGGVMPHGNLLLIQSATHLYCIGPALEGMPGDNPKVVAAIHRTESEDKLLRLLPSSSAQYRYEALKRLFGLGAEIPTNTLYTLAMDDPYQEIRTLAVRALDNTDPERRPGWKVIRRLLIDPMTDLRPTRTAQTHFRQDWVRNTLVSMGTNAYETLVTEVEPRPGADPRIRLGALSALRRMNAVNDRTRDLCLSLVTDDRQPALRLLATRWLVDGWSSDPRTVQTMRDRVLKDRDIQEPAFDFLARALSGPERTAFLRLFGMATGSAADSLRVKALLAALDADPPVRGLTEQVVALAGMEDSAAVMTLASLRPHSEAVAALGKVVSGREDDHFTAYVCRTILRLADRGDISPLVPLLTPLLPGRRAGIAAAAVVIASGGEEASTALANLKKRAAALAAGDIGGAMRLLGPLSRTPGLRDTEQRVAAARILAVLLPKGNYDTKSRAVALLAELKGDASGAIPALRQAAKEEPRLKPTVKAAIDRIE